MAGFAGLAPWRPWIAIDVGTAFFRIAAESLGMVTVPAATAPATLMRGGIVIDPEGVAGVLRPLVSSARGRSLLGPLVLAGVPTDAQAGECEKLTLSLHRAGAARIRMVPEPLAAALGIGLDISSPYAHMILDIGEGVTDCLIIRSGTIERSSASRIGCGVLREGVREGYRAVWGRRLSPVEAERMLLAAGVGRAPPGGLPVSAKADVGEFPVELRSEVQAWIEPAVKEILSVPAALLRQVSDEIGCEVIESGIVLTGGGALIPGLSERLAAATAIRITAVDRPLEAVVYGLQRILAPSRAGW